MLTFIGTGSAFNHERGNTSAFRLSDDGRTMLLFDCGETVFTELRRSNLIDTVEYIGILITHTHADHVGSLASLIMYMYYRKPQSIKVTLYAPTDLMSDITTILKAQGLSGHHVLNKGEEDDLFLYETLTVSKDLSTAQAINDLHTFDPILIGVAKASHMPRVTCYSYQVDFVVADQRKGCIYYSGDNTEIPTRALQRIQNDVYDAAYIDIATVSYSTNVHLPYSELKELVPDINHRLKIHPMHLDMAWDDDAAMRDGFRAVSPYRSDAIRTHIDPIFWRLPMLENMQEDILDKVREFKVVPGLYPIVDSRNIFGYGEGKTIGILQQLHAENGALFNVTINLLNPDRIINILKEKGENLCLLPIVQPDARYIIAGFGIISKDEK